METNPIYAPRAVQKTWTVQNRYGRTYAKFCIFPFISISNGRCLTRLRDIRSCGTKSRVLYASPCYTSCKLRWVTQVAQWRRPAMGTRSRCPAPAKKNICQIIVSVMLLLINSIENIELVFCLRYVSFHLILNLQREKSSQQKEFMIDMEPCDTSIPPSYHHKRELLWAWMCHMV